MVSLTRHTRLTSRDLPNKKSQYSRLAVAGAPTIVTLHTALTSPSRILRLHLDQRRQVELLREDVGLCPRVGDVTCCVELLSRLHGLAGGDAELLRGLKLNSFAFAFDFELKGEHCGMCTSFSSSTVSIGRGLHFDFGLLLHSSTVAVGESRQRSWKARVAARSKRRTRDQWNSTLEPPTSWVTLEKEKSTRVLTQRYTRFFTPDLPECFHHKVLYGLVPLDDKAHCGKLATAVAE